MKNIQVEISNRLKEVRTKYFEAFKLSTAQFSIELEESEFNLQNYESGKASIPNRLLIALYYKGINPIYILTGEGEIYADTPQGRARRERVAKSKTEGTLHSFQMLNTSGMTIQELIEQATQYTAVAGDIMKLVKEKQSKLENESTN
jgi:hypothetical protein